MPCTPLEPGPGAPLAALRRAAKLRAEVARALRARHAPHLVFRRDALSPRQQQVEDVFRQLELEEAHGWAEAEAEVQAVAAGLDAVEEPPAEAAAAAGEGPEAAAAGQPPVR